MVENGNLKEKALQGNIVLVSSEGLAMLHSQIDAVEAEIVAEKVKLGEAAKADPDLPENTMFKESKTRIQFSLTRKLMDLRKQLQITQVYSEDQDGVVRFGTVFRAELDFGGGDIEEDDFVLLGPIEATYQREMQRTKTPVLDSRDPERKALLPSVISYMTPIGKAIWESNLRPGQSTFYRMQVGKPAEATCKIKEIK